MDEYRMARKVLMAQVIGGRLRRRPTVGWMDGWRDGMKIALGNRNDWSLRDNARKIGITGEPWYICN